MKKYVHVFFLEYAGELHIIVLIEERERVLHRPKHTPTHPLNCKTLIAYYCRERPDHTPTKLRSTS